MLFVTLIIACFWSLDVYYQTELNQCKDTALLKKDDFGNSIYVQLIKAQNAEKLWVPANKVGNLHAQVNRLNALGKRIAENPVLPEAKFDFDLPLPIGGFAMPHKRSNFN